jgi:hypothetical protein
MSSDVGLGPDAGERAWLQNLQRLQDGRNGKKQIFHSISLCAYNQNGNWEGFWGQWPLKERVSSSEG